MRTGVRALRGVPLVVMLGAPAISPAATFLALSSEGVNEPVLQGRRLRVNGNGFSTFPTDAGGLTVFPPNGGFSVYFVPPGGQRFAPGSYDGATNCPYSTRPGVCVGGYYEDPPVGGHLEVLEVAYDGSGHLSRFAADFSQHGVREGDGLAGSIRVDSGGGACAGVADGTPCDDRDACSASSLCVRGRCAAVDETTCGGAPAGPCHDAAMCDPIDGACHLPTTWVDGCGCFSEDQCASAGSCRGGVCNASVAQPCTDFNPCTYDVCNTRTGCSFPPIPGVCGQD